ncbi:hypothetical protein COR50_16720 [Chitinophaga caeni]|uniref:Nickel transport complex protein, NikM subunit, transmembrane n=1 Tax=Chitinophaga caeni TaxID=2029983 RepID=A0A291QXK5_9BACT|nr:DUF4198 domain-containing protein [Chitinophaga caeni]ATL48675.1 hypothetical protein COR50_16720 [Chitinophaga caeni]
MKAKLLLLVSCLFLSMGAFAHMLWIETAAKGKAGVKQNIKIFYGEPAEGKPEMVKDWYSDVKEFKLFVLHPGGQKTELPVKIGAKYCTSEFTPGKDGNYTLMISHDAKDLGGTTLYQFNAYALVQVGGTNTEPANTGNVLALSMPTGVKKIQEPFHMNATVDGKAAAESHIAVFSPSGWNKTIKAGKDGSANFIPLWPGYYLFELTNMRAESGQINGKDYENVWRNATIRYEVIK